MKKNTFFQPHVGKNYTTGGIFGKRIMVLGESHYCDEKCKDCGLFAEHRSCTKFTNNVINDYLNEDKKRERWMNTFLKFERSLVDHKTDWSERKEIWQSILFYNYLQVAMTGPRKPGSNLQYAQATSSFYEVIDTYKPQYIVAWGKRLWNYLPGDVRWHWDIPIKIEGFNVLRGFYTLNNGDKAMIISVYHPSGGYSWDWWFKVIREFLK